MASDRARPEYHEGTTAARRFEDSVGRVLRISKDELNKREAAYKESRRTKKSSSKIEPSTNVR